VNGAPRLVRSLVGLRSPVAVPEAIQAIAFSPDGKLVAASDVTETGPGHESAALPLATLAIWRTSSGDLVTPPRELDVGNGPGGSDVLAFSRDGKLLAVSLLHGGALVIDAATGQTRRRLSDPGDDIISLAFAPDGTLATGTLAGTVDLWNPRSGARLAPSLLAASAPIASIAFASDGERFATSGYQDGTVKLWSTTTLHQEGPDLNTDPGATSAVVFAPADRALIATDDLGDTFTWPMSLAAWEQRACAVAGRDLSRQEWGRLVSELPYATVCRSAVSAIGSATVPNLHKTAESLTAGLPRGGERGTHRVASAALGLIAASAA
jgi:WD40 repeat protein